MTAPSVISLVLLSRRGRGNLGLLSLLGHNEDAARRARAVNDHRPCWLQKDEGRAGHPSPYSRLPSSAAAARRPSAYSAEKRSWSDAGDESSPAPGLPFDKAAATPRATRRSASGSGGRPRAALVVGAAQ